MIRGLYTATSGMLCETLRQDMIANNLANVDTPGFKKMVSIFKELPTMNVKKVNDGRQYPPRPNELYPTVGKLGTGVILDESYTDFSAGRFENTGNDLDCALQDPKAFFMVQTPHGVRYTRNGVFNLNKEGYLTNMNGDFVLAEAEPAENENPVLVNDKGKPSFNFSRIQVAQGEKLEIDAEGRVLVDGVPRFRILKGMATDQKALRKEGSTLYNAAYGDIRRAPGEVKQGYVEKPNFTVVEEMVKMIEVSRAYEANSKVVQAQDSVLDKAINTVGRSK
ncbi:MAG: flagellar hook-basal body protein [Candidatus Riflebacteria bacterium]|nr:flagellar hook-basal body protein [Candidatus Riflebacteria bacterium]